MAIYHKNLRIIAICTLLTTQSNKHDSAHNISLSSTPYLNIKSHKVKNKKGKFRPQVTAQVQLGARDGDSLGQLSAFLPITHSNTVIAADVRTLYNNISDKEHNVGASLGHMFTSNMGVRGYMHYDHRTINTDDTSQHKNTHNHFTGLTLGGEVHYKNLLTRLSGFMPLSNDPVVATNVHAFSSRYKTANLGDVTTIQAEKGFEAEFGVSKQMSSKLKAQVLLGSYVYGDLSDPATVGARVRSELAYNAGSVELKAGFKVEYDKPNGWRPMLCLGVSNSNKEEIECDDYRGKIMQEFQTAPYRDPDIRVFAQDRSGVNDSVINAKLIKKTDYQIIESGAKANDEKPLVNANVAQNFEDRDITSIMPVIVQPKPVAVVEPKPVAVVEPKPVAVVIETTPVARATPVAAAVVEPKPMAVVVEPKPVAVVIEPKPAAPAVATAPLAAPSTPAARTPTEPLPILRHELSMDNLRAHEARNSPRTITAPLSSPATTAEPANPLPAAASYRRASTNSITPSESASQPAKEPTGATATSTGGTFVTLERVLGDARSGAPTTAQPARAQGWVRDVIRQFDNGSRVSRFPAIDSAHTSETATSATHTQANSAAASPRVVGSPSFPLPGQPSSRTAITTPSSAEVVSDPAISPAPASQHAPSRGLVSETAAACTLHPSNASSFSVLPAAQPAAPSAKQGWFW